jgi:D-alanyl-D-alanine carboxypeptidase
LAFVLAGEIVSVVSAEPYPEYIHRHILKPLGMTNSSVVLPPEHRLRLATGYGRRMPDGTRQLSPFSDLKGLTPAGGMSSTVEDLARFAALQCRDGPASGAQILKGSTLREMHRVHWLDTDWARGWGLGFMLRRQENRALIEHGGSVLGSATWLSSSPQEKIAVIVLTNATDGHPSLYGDQALALLAPAITKAGMPTPQIAGPDPAWQTYVGKYRNRWGDLQVLVWNGALVLISPAELDPRQSMAMLVPQGEHRFTLTGNDGFMELGATVVFELGPDGRVARMKLGENCMYRVD